MKELNLIFIGKPKYDGIDNIVNIFKKRILTYFVLKEYFFIEKDFKILKNQTWLEKEIKKVVQKKRYKLIVFSPEGILINSNKFSSELFSLFNQIDRVVFLIGGKNGIPAKLKNNACKVISFSPMVFGHQIFRIMLYEQIYRAITLKYNLRYS